MARVHFEFVVVFYFIFIRSYNRHWTFKYTLKKKKKTNEQTYVRRFRRPRDVWGISDGGKIKSTMNLAIDYKHNNSAMVLWYNLSPQRVRLGECILSIDRR